MFILDDSFDDESISINNNSLVQPLDFSASSEDSFKDADGFLVPRCVVYINV